MGDRKLGKPRALFSVAVFVSSPRPVPDSGVTDKTLGALSKILPRVLARECGLVHLLRDFGGNVTGPRPHSLLKLCDDQERQLNYWLTQLRHRTGSLGLKLPDSEIRGATEPVGTIRAFRTPAVHLLHQLRVQHDELSRDLRAGCVDLPDAATARLLERLAEVHDTAAWMLRIVVDGPNRVVGE